MASNPNQKSPATEVEEITLSSDSEVEERNEMNLTEDSGSSSPPTPPLPSRSQNIEMVMVEEEASSPPAANIATAVFGGASPRASTSMKVALSSSMGSLSFAELRAKVTQLEESERAAKAKLKICEAENAQMVADSQTKLADLTERLQESERKNLELEEDSTAKVEGLKDELQQLWSHLTTILERSDMDRGEVAGAASEEKDVLSQVNQTIAKLEAEWDANAAEAKKETEQLQMDVQRTNAMVHQVIQMLNDDEGEDQDDENGDPQRMEVEQE